MEVIKGKDVILEFLSPHTGDYLPYVCADDCSIRFTSSQLSTKTRGDGPWERFIMDTKGYSISLGGLIPYTDETATGVNTWDLYEYYDQMTDVPFRMIFRDPASNLIKAILGNVLVTDLDIPANATDFAGSTLSFKGNGPPSVQDNLLACQASIAEVTISFQNELAVHFSYSGLSESARIDYAIDGGSRYSHFASSSSGLININPVQVPEAFVNGAHTVIFYPLCESGEDGTPFTLEFTKT